MKAAVVRAFGQPVIHKARPLTGVHQSVDGSVGSSIGSSIDGSLHDVPRGEIRARIVSDMGAGR
ncbi:hypothetical protein ACIOKD_36480 [Streptomyces sp. NPDC087844]|uniref:hypothetical protein n=1 Tax=Streptomyces sp. NPDC087844 TaxID=3365805 RepID=UPI0038257115